MNLRQMFSVDGDLISLIASASILLALIAFIEAFGFPELTLLRVAVGVPFVLLFPGYALTCMLFPRRGQWDGAERIALSLGLSLSIVPLIGLLLYYSPWGMRPHPFITTLFLFSLLTSIVAAYRRSTFPPGDRFVPPMRKVLVVTLGMYAIATAFVAAYALTPIVGQKFTEFYVLNSNRKIGDIPTNLTLGENLTAILGIVNRENRDVTYTIVIESGNEAVRTIDGIALKHQETWEGLVSFTPTQVGERVRVDFLLYTDSKGENKDTPYKSLHLWIRVEQRG